MVVSAVKESPDPEKAPLNNYLMITTSKQDNNQQYAENGNKRDFAVWRIVESEQPNQFFLRNKGQPGYVMETPRYGDFYKWVTIDSNCESCIDYRVSLKKRVHILLQITAISVN